MPSTSGTHTPLNEGKIVLPKINSRSRAEVNYTPQKSSLASHANLLPYMDTALSRPVLNGPSAETRSTSQLLQSHKKRLNDYSGYGLSKPSNPY